MPTDEEDYIDMDLNSSPSKNPDFEFQMSFSCDEERTQHTNTSPADELFYKGKLLPLHLPPRQQMVEDLVSKITNTPFEEDRDDFYCHHSMPLVNYSCNFSPSESRRVSNCDQNPDLDFLFSKSSGDLSYFVDNRPTKKPWSKKIGEKLKASSAYFKSLFTKSLSPDEQEEESNLNFVGVNQNLTKNEALLSKYSKIRRKQPFGHISRISCPKIATSVDDNNVSRRSFSGAIKGHSPTKCLSSSSSDSSSSSCVKSNGQYEFNFIRRSSSVNEIEASIDAAIDHCKKSLQDFHTINLGGDEEHGKKAKFL